jgi:hypothetical protein
LTRSKRRKERSRLPGRKQRAKAAQPDKSLHELPSPISPDAEMPNSWAVLASNILAIAKPDIARHLGDLELDISRLDGQIPRSPVNLELGPDHPDAKIYAS